MQSFPEPLKFNTDTGGFEVLTSARHELADKIKAVVRLHTPISSVYKVRVLRSVLMTLVKRISRLSQHPFRRNLGTPDVYQNMDDKQILA